MRWNAAPFRGLALILTLVPAAPPGSKGLPLRVAYIEPWTGGDAGPSYVIHALRDGLVGINREELRRSELGARLDVILSTRAEKMVYVTAEADLPFGEVAGLIDIATAHAEHVALLPPLNLLRGQPYVPMMVFKNWEVYPFRGKDGALPAWR
jgi:hypothetical protein